MEYTLDEIAYRTGFNKSSICRRLKNTRPVDRRSDGGRPVNYYDSSVLSLFHILDMQEPSVQVFHKEESVIVMKSKKNPCKNISRVLSQELADSLSKKTFTAYITQADRYGLKRACADTIYAYWDLIAADLAATGKECDSRGNLRDLEYMQDYWYFKVINRSDKINQGTAKRENWEKTWEEKHDYNKSNGRKATARYSMLEMLENADLIAPGRGAGLIWVIDGTQFDAFVEHENGDKKSFNYLLIMDGVTKMPLYAKALQDGEKISEVAEALWECVNIHGVPPLGIIADNGAAFKSRDIQALVRSWYTPEQLAYFESGCLIRRELYRNKDGKPQRGAILYPLAKVPRAPFKALLERTFREINRHQSSILAASYIGTRDSKAVTHELGTTPTEALRLAPTKTEAWKSFLWFIYFNYSTRLQPGSEWLSYVKTKYKVKPSPAEAWKFYGGKLAISEEKTDSCIRRNGKSTGGNDSTEEKMQIGKVDIQSEARLVLNEEQAIPFYEWAKADKKRHKVTCKDNYVAVTHNKESHTYNSECLGMQMWGKEVIVVVDSYNSRRSYIFAEKELSPKEKQLAKQDNIVLDQSECLQYLGEGFSTLINDFAQVRDVRKRNSDSRKRYAKEIEAFDAKMLDGEGYELKNHKVEAGQYAEYQVLDADVQPNSPLAGQLLSSENLPKGKEAFGRYEEADVMNLLDITDLMDTM